MKFNDRPLEKDSFMFIPNEFTENHQLTHEEILASITPDPEYWNRASSFKKGSIIQRIREFLSKNRAEKSYT